MARLLVYTLCFASGVAGLTYEVIWLRMLALVVGNATYATTAVLAAVMGGMGLGAWLGGRRADGTDALRLYGQLEIALGLCALAVPFVAQAAAAAAPPVLRLAGTGWSSAGLRLLLAGSVVLVPSVLMGATLPALVRFAQTHGRTSGDAVGPSTGTLYGLNTAGAALGCVATGYWALGALGIRRTSALAAAVDVGVGIAALSLARWLRIRQRAAAPAPSDEALAASPAPTAPLPPALPKTTVLGLAFAVGLSVLALETLWTRYLLIVFGHDVHAFASMLAAVLAGLAAGAALYRVLPARVRASALLVPCLLGALGLGAAGALAAMTDAYLARGVDVLDLAPGLAITRSHERGIVLEAVFAAGCVLLPAVASGALLPALTASHRGPEGARGWGGGARVGRVLAYNTLGSITGALIAPLALVPWLGIDGAFAAIAAFAASVALVALAAATRRWRFRRAIAAVPLAAAVALAAWLVPADLGRRVLARKIGSEHNTLELYREGRTGTVAVSRNLINGDRQLFVNGINEVTTRLVHDQSFALLGHLGLLLHPEPEQVGVVCLGAGLSAGAASLHEEVRSIDVVDLEPAVAAGAERFSDMNHGVLDDPRTRIVHEDGRAFLHATEKRYDVLVVDSTHPRAVDSWLLYTRELYRTAASRLADDGWMVQWIPLHGLTVDEVGIIARTFQQVFPGASLWANAGIERYGPAAYALLVGRKGADELVIDREQLARRIAAPAVQEDLERWGLGTVQEVLECFVAGPDALRRWTRGLPVNTDDLPYTQFLTEHSRGAAMEPDRLLEVRSPVQEHLEPPPPAGLSRGLARRRAAQGLLLTGRLERAAEVCGPGCAKPAMYEREVARAVPYYRALGARYRDDPDRLLEASAGLVRFGAAGEAARLLERATRLAPGRPRLWMHLGIARARAGRSDAAIRAQQRALGLQPELALARMNLGLVLLEQGRVDAAIGQLDWAAQLAPSVASVHSALGWGLLHRGGEGPRAERHLRRALELDPRDRRAALALGRLWLRRHRPARAREVLSRARDLHPLDTDVLFTLAVARQREGDRAGAARVLEALLEVAPEDAQAAGRLAALRDARADATP